MENVLYRMMFSAVARFLDSCHHRYIYTIMDMDTDSVSALAAQEACQSQHFKSEMPEEGEHCLTRQTARRRERIASETADQREICLAADRACRKWGIASESVEQ